MVRAVLGEGTYSSQVCGISQCDAGQTVFLCPLDTNIHGLNTHDAAEASASIDVHNRTVVSDYLSVTMRVHMLIQNAFDIRRNHANTVRVMAFEVGFDKVFCNRVSMN